MNMNFNTQLTIGYKNNSQIARILTETWVEQNMFCPRCGNLHIVHFKNNRPVADFFCESCRSEYELKSKNGNFGDTVTDGAYDTMISRITHNNNPDFMFMSYSMSSACVSNLFFVPKHFFTPAVIKKRKPLSNIARRAGWTGCSIMLDMIPKQGRIPIVTNGIAANTQRTVMLVHQSSKLEISNIDSRGWLLDVLNCVNSIANNDFILSDIYKYENTLSILHPNNNNIQAKIRQQLQLLRDAGIIEFQGKGHYRKITNE